MGYQRMTNFCARSFKTRADHSNSVPHQQSPANMKRLASSSWVPSITASASALCGHNRRSSTLNRAGTASPSYCSSCRASSTKISESGPRVGFSSDGAPPARAAEMEAPQTPAARGKGSHSDISPQLYGHPPLDRLQPTQHRTLPCDGNAQGYSWQLAASSS
jgi:hypothetical protein